MTLFSLLFPLMIKGSLALATVFILKFLFPRLLSAKGFKTLFLSSFLISITPFHLLSILNIPLPTIPKTVERIVSPLSSIHAQSPSAPSTDPSASSQNSHFIPWFLLFWGVWGSGTIISLLRFYLQTQRTTQRFRTLPQSTLLQELEACKQQAEIFAPIGIIETAETKTPAILGWLRPRILLPQGFSSQWNSEERQSVLLHELAHFRSADALGLTVARIALAVHWWNPLFHFAYHSYRQQIEFAADKFVIEKSNPSVTKNYPHLLLKFSLAPLVQTEPLGALGIRENYQTLKQRIEMIQNQKTKKATILSPLLFLLSISLFLGLALFSWSEDQTSLTTAAEQAATSWLKIIDQGQYKVSHEQSSQFFKEELTPKKWIEALNSVRKPLGKLLSRKVISKTIQEDVPNGNETVEGTFCIIQAETSFENLKSSIETISLQLESDGQWRATGYFIKPN